MEKNFYDMTAVSGKTVNDAKRIQAQTADYLANYNRQLQESLQEEEDKKMNAAMSAARFGYAANVARSKDRINKLNEEIRYTNESSIIGMTEMVAQVVEAGLLLDESELVKIHPQYKEEIREIVKGFLKEGELNSKVTNKDTLALMEYVARQLPSVREGVSLTEDELSNYIAINKPLDIERSIKNLGGDVASRVATLMEKEQKKAEQIEKDVKRAKAKEAKAAATDEVSAEELIHGLEGGQLTEADLEEMLKNGEISQDTYDEVIAVYEDAANGEVEAAEEEEVPAEEETEEEVPEAPVTTSAEAPVEEEEVPAEGAPMDPAMAGQAPADPAMAAEGDPTMAGAEAPMDPAMGGQAAPGTPKKQIQMLPDGTMNINIYENDFAFVRETPRCGLIESLAVNEATQMLNEGKAYDGDLCLAKAITYVTITETMNELGLMNIDNKKYSEIISAAGGTLNEVRTAATIDADAHYKNAKIAAKAERRMGRAEAHRRVDEAKKLETEEDRKKGKEEAISNYKALKDRTRSAVRDAKMDRYLVHTSEKARLAHEKVEKKANVQKAKLNESVIATQYVPVRNDINEPDSLAKRIRQLRLQEQQQNLND